MPKRLNTNTSKSVKTVHKRSDGTEMRFYQPHSPFQRLLNAAIERKRLSLRAASELLGTNPTTLWAWLHNEPGYPGNKWSEEILESMCRHLNLKRPDVEQAINASRVAYGEKAEPAPAPVASAFDDFIDVLKKMKGRRLDREPLLRLAERLRASAVSPAPVKKKSRAPRAKKRPDEK